MNILSIDYVFDEGALDIYIAGCRAEPKCSGCFNPESWSFDQGSGLTTELYQNSIDKYLNKFSSIIQEVRILGGEPLDQKIEELHSLLDNLHLSRSKYNSGFRIFLFTRYEYDNVREDIKVKLDKIKCGAYDNTKLSDTYISHGLKLASTNQKVYDVEKE